MTQDDKSCPSLAQLEALERGVWQALLAGDPAADRAALAPDFLGVYPSGLSDRDGHTGQLAAGPTIAEYEIFEPRRQVYGPDLCMLVYRARYRRPGREAREEMYVSSLWRREGGGWRNLFSQDTPLAD